MSRSLKSRLIWRALSAVVMVPAMGCVLTTKALAWAPGLEYRNQPGLAAIKVYTGDPLHPSAYDMGYFGQGVRIGISDGGINPSHVEFVGAIVAGYNARTGQSGTSNFSSFLRDDDDGHGTHVASIAAGRRDGVDRALNMQGSAYEASLVIGAWPIGWSFEEQDGYFASTLDYISAQNVKVINNSWGTSRAGPDPRQDAATFLEDYPNTNAALKRALASGAVIVFANGNDRLHPGYGLNPKPPGAMPSFDADMAAYGAWITVAATSNDGTAITDYSNFCGLAMMYCVAAPGGLRNDDPSGMNGASGAVDDGYVYMSGTSMAAPLVSGAIALVAQKYPWMNSRNLTTTILTTAADAAAPTRELGRGLIDVSRAIHGPGIFEEDFDANVPQGYESVFANDISGTHGLIKRGAGSLTLRGVNTYAGITYLRGGVLVVHAQSGLGSSTAALQFDGGTLKLGRDFDLTREFLMGDQGGAIDLNGFTKTQTFGVAGTGQFGVIGGGTLVLTRTNTQRGGLAIRSAGDAPTTVQAQKDSYLGAPQSAILLDGGELTLAPGFEPSQPGIFDRPLLIGVNNGLIDTNDQALAFTGATISNVSGGNQAGVLRFRGRPFSLGADLNLNAFWEGDLDVPHGITLSGLGSAIGNLTVAGGYSPGNSPGVVQTRGSITLLPGSELTIEIDGPGTLNGAGQYDRIVMLNTGSTFTAGGTLAPRLRGIGGQANNNFTPELGQGFSFVQSVTGVSGSFAALEQPPDGLPGGMRFDVVYAPRSLTLYATPRSYADIAASGVATSPNRHRLGLVLESIRPQAGVRELDADRKYLFDQLAMQTTASLPQGLDQLGGVGYVQLIGTSQENARFLVDETMLFASMQRRGEGVHIVHSQGPAQSGASSTQYWIKALGRRSTWRGDGTGSTTTDSLGGMIVGVQKALSASTTAGVSLAFAASNPDISNNLASGAMQNLQVMGYGTRGLEGGFFLQGAAGLGMGQIQASRTVFMLDRSYNSNIYVGNLVIGGMVGWRKQDASQVSYEMGAGLTYMAMRNAGFTDSASQAAYQISGQPTTNQSFTAALSAAVNLPFEAQGVSWLASASLTYSHELADDRAFVNTTLLGGAAQVQSASIGRDRITLGVGLSAMVNKRTRIGLTVTHQSAANWNATAALLSARMTF